jgi:hypothetical protein
MKSKRKKRLVGWITRGYKWNGFHRGELWHQDYLILHFYRGNPNPNNYTKTNNWEKVRITIEEI